MVSDRHFEAIALNYASIAFKISTLIAFAYMTVIQYLLLKVNRSKLQVTSPTSFEQCLVIGALWIFHRIVDSLTYFIIDAVVLVLSPQEALGPYRNFRGAYNIRYWARGTTESGTVLPGLVLLFYEVLLTWLISQSIVTLFDTLIPIFRDIRLDHQYVAVKFQTRCIELFDFSRRIYQEDTSKRPLNSSSVRLGYFGNEKTNSQAVNLKRHQSDNPNEGQRVLNWDLTIDKRALDEMKETLGPPGGFGELGFNVASDKVCFGAMGVGTSFNLTFVLERAESEILMEDKRRTSR